LDRTLLTLIIAKGFMNKPSVSTTHNGLSRIKLFWALSRTPHGLLDMATPAFAALLWIGGFPSLYVMVLGLITTFAGYTAVYALNDVVDHRVDKEKLKRGGFQDYDDYLDAVLVRHLPGRGSGASSYCPGISQF
jgi:4-hydroxybenzoate polyprenyltransferase